MRFLFWFETCFRWLWVLWLNRTNPVISSHVHVRVTQYIPRQVFWVRTGQKWSTNTSSGFLYDWIARFPGTFFLSSNWHVNLQVTIFCLWALFISANNANNFDTMKVGSEFLFINSYRHRDVEPWPCSKWCMDCRRSSEKSYKGTENLRGTPWWKPSDCSCHSKLPKLRLRAVRKGARGKRIAGKSSWNYGQELRPFSSR